ncbi:MAG: hypothetical protein H0W20_00575 [Chthoniobacterales bacterium]|nr:hypothetical protein [Chthoniobacterales bacterium]
MAALVAVSATAQIIVPGTANPYLAGMPDGSTAKGGDTAPAQSPVLVQLRDFAAGDQLTFSATGATSFAGGTPPANGTPDGDSFFANSEENNISGCTYPLNALIGVFLTGEPPVTSPGGSPSPAPSAPPGLDFSPSGNVPGGTNYTQLAPQLRQIFFIGDGKTSAGAVQRITAPAGATRLFLASTDGFGWFNNTGSFSVTVAAVPASPPAPTPVAPPQGGLSATVLTVNGSSVPSPDLADMVLRFAAQQTGEAASLVVRMQATTTPNVESSWVELPNGSNGYMTWHPTARRFVLNATNYPLANGVSFRAITAAPGYIDSISNVVGPFNLATSQSHLGPTVLYLAANGPGQEIRFRATETSPPAGVGLRIQASTNPGLESSWTDLADGNLGRMLPYSDPTRFYLDSTKYPSGDTVYFRAVASASGYIDSLSNAIGVTNVIAGTPPGVIVVNPAEQPGSGSGLTPGDPLIVNGNLRFGAVVNDTGGKSIQRLAVLYDNSQVDVRTGGATSLTVDYQTSVPGDHVIKAMATDERGITGYADPIYIRVLPSGGKLYRMVNSGSWSDAKNWQDAQGNNGIPGANDFAIVGAANATITSNVTSFALSLVGGSISGSSGGLTVTGFMSIAGGQLRNVNLTIDSRATMSVVGDENVPLSGTVTNHGRIRLTGRGGILPVSSSAGVAMRDSYPPGVNANFFDGVAAFFKNLGEIIFHRPSVKPKAPSPAPAIPPPVPPARVFTAAAIENVGKIVSEKGGGIVATDGATLIGQDGTSLIGQDGTSLIGQDGTSLIGQDGTSLIPQQGGSVIAAPLIGQDGSSLIGQDGTSLIGNEGTSLRIQNSSGARTSNVLAATGVSGFTQTGGETNLSNMLIFAPVTLNGGVLTGSGAIFGNLTNNGGYISPGRSPGAITAIGNFAQGAQGTLILESGGSHAGQFDSLRVFGNAALGGTLDVRLIDGYTPTTSQTFNPLGYRSVTGGFNTTSGNTSVTFGAKGAIATMNAAIPNTPPAKLVNISTRMRVETGENALIGGFILTGTAPKKVLIRAIGPSLSSAGVAAALQDPTLTLNFPNGASLFNDNWRQTQESEIRDTTIPPADEREAAIVAMLEPGAYTAVVRGNGNTSGVGLVEVYDLSAGVDSQLANISTRGQVQIGENVMIGGVIVAGQLPAKVLIRAIGPSLVEGGVENALQDPELELVDGNGNGRANDDWQQAEAAEIAATTVPPRDPRESAIVATLVPGNYTAIVRGKDDTTGVALVEAYRLE